LAFVSYTPRPTSQILVSALDFSGLNALKQGVRAGADAPLAQQKAVAQQFEAMFIQMMLKQARQTSTMMPSMFDSSAMRMAKSLRDEQAALQMASPGLGLAEALLNQIRSAQISVNGKRDPSGNVAELTPSHLWDTRRED